jgi:hypothetical protein
MSVLNLVKSGKQDKPRKTLLYGVHGSGKSTWASQWPKPLFLDLENGVADLDVVSINCHDSIDLAWGAIIELSGEHELQIKTVVIDSVDWLERLISEDICRKANKDALSDFDFGKGKGKLIAAFSKVLKAMEQLTIKGYHVVLLAHADASKVEPPDSASYHRYGPKLMDAIAEMVQEWCDEVLFVNYDRKVKEVEEGFSRTRGIAVGSGQRLLYTTEKPSHLAKNRLNLPDVLPFDFASYAQYLNKKQGN